MSKAPQGPTFNFEPSSDSIVDLMKKWVDMLPKPKPEDFPTLQEVVGDCTEVPEEYKNLRVTSINQRTVGEDGDLATEVEFEISDFSEDGKSIKYTAPLDPGTWPKKTQEITFEDTPNSSKPAYDSVKDYLTGSWDAQFTNGQVLTPIHFCVEDESMALLPGKMNYVCITDFLYSKVLADWMVEMGQSFIILSGYADGSYNKVKMEEVKKSFFQFLIEKQYIHPFSASVSNIPLPCPETECFPVLDDMEQVFKATLLGDQLVVMPYKKQEDVIGDIYQHMVEKAAAVKLVETVESQGMD